MKNRFLIKKRTRIALCIVAGMSVLGGCSEKSMEGHITEARALIEQGNLEAAIIEYKNAIQRDPNASQPRYELGKLYLKAKRFAEAEKELSRAQELGHNSAELLPLLSQVYQRTGAENALSQVNHMTQGMTSVEQAQVGYYKLQALVELEKTDEALALIDELSALDTNSVYVGLAGAFKPIIEKNYQAALDKVKLLKEQAPLNQDVLQQLANLYLVAKDSDNAIAVLKDYVSLFPEDIARRFALVAMLIESKRMGEAKPLVDELLALNQEHPILNQYKGVIAASEEEHALALSHLEKAIQFGNADPVVRLVAGFSAYKLQNFEAAKKHLSMVASRLPDDHPGLRMLADSLLQEGDSSEAYEVLNRLGGDYEADATLFSQAGLQLLQSGNVVDAKTMAQRSAELSVSPQALTKLGVLKLSLNDIDGLVELEKAVEAAPDLQSTQATLVKAYVIAGQLDKAREMAQSWAEVAPDNAEPLVTLANLALMEDKFSDVDQYLAQAEAVSPTEPGIVHTRIRVAQKQGQVDDAMAQAKQRLNVDKDDAVALAMWYALALERGDTSEVIDFIDSRAATKDDSVMNLFVARVYLAESQIDKALSALNNIDVSATTPIAYWKMRGQALVQANDVKQATEHYEAWLARYPQNLDAVKGMLLIMEVDNRPVDAIELIDRTLEKRPDEELKILKAYFLTLAGKTGDALSLLEPMSDEVKALPFVRGVRARIFLAQDQAVQAVPHALAAYENRPKIQNLLLIVAAYERSGQSDMAFALLQKHMSANPDDPRAGLLYAERLIGRDAEAAITTYENVLKQLPNNFVVLNNLAYMYMEKGDLARAKTLAEQAVEQKPNNADTIDTLAQINKLQGDKESALKLYERVLTQKNVSDEVYLNYVELLLESGNMTLAKRRLGERSFNSDQSKARVETLKQKYSF